MLLLPPPLELEPEGRLTEGGLEDCITIPGGIGVTDAPGVLVGASCSQMRVAVSPQSGVTVPVEVGVKV